MCYHILVERGNISREQQQTQQLKVGNAGGDDHNSFGLQSSNTVSSLSEAHLALIEETRQNKCAKNTLYQPKNARRADTAAQIPITHFYQLQS